MTIDAHKRKINHITGDFVDGNSQKRIKVSHSTPGNTDANALLHISCPVSTIWSNNSCVYDSVFSILYTLWKDASDHWRQDLCRINAVETCRASL